MLVEYATKVLGRTAEPVQGCAFTDISRENEEM